MLRGVNKNIIEVPQTDNAYFERAILFVRPNFQDKPPEFLHRQAQDYLRSMPTPKQGSAAGGVQTRARGGLGVLTVRSPRLWLYGSAAMALALLLKNFIV